MEIYKVTDKRFGKYGKVIKDIDFSSLVKTMEEKTPLPEGVEYVPGFKVLEALPVAEELRVKTFGELPVQVGYCNGHNAMLNALEYHRSSEVNVAATDAILILGSQQDITEDFTYGILLLKILVILLNISWITLWQGKEYIRKILNL